MLGFNKSESLCFLFTICSLFITSGTQYERAPSPYFCGKVKIQYPFLDSNMSSPLTRMIRCNSQKLYFRTSLGLLAVSSIDYTTKVLTLSHPSSSFSSDHYISPSLLSAGFPSPQPPNSLLLLNCSSRRFSYPTQPSIRNCKANDLLEQELKLAKSCLLVKNTEELDPGFHPKDFGCSSYRRVHRRSLSDERVEIGTRVSFEVPHNLPDICKECEKPNGNCGVGLKCICHAKECKDKIISGGRSLTSVGNVLFSWIFLIIVTVPSICS